MKKLFKLILPPFVLLLLKYTERKISYNTKSIRGYQNDLLVSMIVRKTKLFRDDISNSKFLNSEDFRTISIIGLSNLRDGSVILDFGGGAGVHYFTLKRNFPMLKLNWIVVETPEMVRQAKSLENLELKFVDSIENAVILFNNFDLILANSSLQYCSEPLIQLRKLTNIHASHIFIVRTIMNDNVPESTIQRSFLSKNGPGALPGKIEDFIVEYKVKCELKDCYRNVLSGNYEIVFEVADGYVTDALSGKKFEMHSLFARLIHQS